MDSRTFRLGLFVVLALCLIVGTIGYFSNSRMQIDRDADVEITSIKQDKKTERTKERWGVLPWNRGLTK